MVAVPVIGLGHINAFLLADHQERPEFADFDHLRWIHFTPIPSRPWKETSQDSDEEVSMGRREQVVVPQQGVERLARRV